MAFLVGLRLPDDVERGALGGPRFNTTVLSLDSGFEKRNQNWIDTRGEWNLGYGLLQKFQTDPTGVQLDLDDLIHFFYVLEAKTDSFRFKDWSDFEIGFENGTEIAVQFLGLGEGGTPVGSKTVYDVFKRYFRPGNAKVFDRSLTKIVGSTVQIFLNGSLQTLTTHYTVDEDRAKITMVTAPGGAGSGGNGPGGEDLLEIRTEFENHVRFDTDALDVNMEVFNAGGWPDFPIIELRENGVD